VIPICGCELHDSSTALTVCSCICEEHDKFFSSDAVILRKAIRSLNSRVYALQQDMGQAHEAIGVYSKGLPGIYLRLGGIEDELKRVNDRLSPPEKEAGLRLPDMTDEEYRKAVVEAVSDLPPDMWDRFGVRWTPVLVGDKLAWDSGGRLRDFDEVSKRGPLTLKSPLAEDQEPLPDVGETHPDNDHWKDRAVIAERKLEYLKQAIANA
jgi:hypothetical protein